MNLLAARVALRQRTLADVLDLALPLCLANRRPFGTLALLALGPIAGLAAVLRLRGHWSWGFVWCVILEASFLAEGVFTVALGELLFREPAEVGAGSVGRAFAARLPSYLVAVIGRQLVLLVSTFLVFVPFVQGPATQFVGDALLLERSSPGTAWARSRALARNRGAFCLGLWLTTLVFPVIGAFVGDQIGNAVVGFVLQLGRPAGDLLADGGSGFAVAGALLAAPVAAAARFLGYLDLRTRKEGWDIQLRFVALAADAAARPRRAA
jgi:hypothetical protein